MPAKGTKAKRRHTKMKKSIAILMTLAVMAVFASLALARGGGPGYGYGWQASPQQQAEWNQARAKFLEDTVELRQQMVAKRTELAKLYSQESPDQARIKAVQSEMIDLRSAIAKKAAEAGLPAGRGFGRGGRGGFGPGSCPGFGGGYGPRGGHMMGYGYGGGFGPGGGPCWR
jgi:zinc resistance-associated protein